MTTQPSTLDYLIFSQLAYDITEGKTLTFQIPSSWTEIPPDPSAGVNAVAFQNAATKQIIVAFRGTDITSSSDLSIDGAIAGGTRPSAFDAAETYIRRLQGNPLYQGYSFSVTGHSLGGAEAQDVAAALQLNGASFGAPGVASILTAGVSPNISGFTNYVIATDGIGLDTATSGAHIGSTQILPPPTNIACHQS